MPLPVRWESKAGRPQDPKMVTFRRIVREFMLTPAAIKRVQDAIMDPESTEVLREAMKMTFGPLDAEPGQQVLNINFFAIAETLGRLAPEAIEHYAATGELPAHAYTVDVEPLDAATP